MKKYMILMILLLVIFNCQLSVVKCQSWKELMDSSKAYQIKKEFANAFSMAEKAFSIAEIEFGKSDTNYADNLWLLADLNDDTGNDVTSVELGSLAIEIYKANSKNNDIKIAKKIDNLGYWYIKLNNLEKGEQLYEEALQLYKKAFVKDDLEMANCSNNLAELYRAEGKKTEAERLYLESIAMKRRLFKDGHLDLAKSIMNLGSLYLSIGKVKEGDALLKETLEMSRKLLKGDNPNIAFFLIELSKFYKQIGRFNDAEGYIKEALEINKKLYQVIHPEIARCINELALVYYSQGRYNDAEPLFKEALEMNRKLSSFGNYDIGTILNNLGLLYRNQGNLKDAEQCLKESYEIARVVCKDDYSSLAAIYNNLSDIYRLQGRNEDAEPLLKEGLELSKRVYKGDHPLVATVLNNLGELYQGEGKYADAESLLKEAVAMNKRIYKGDAPDLAASINALAWFYHDQGKMNDAEPLYVESMKMYKRLYTGNHIDVHASMYNLAFLYLCQERFDEAEKLYKECLVMGRKLFVGESDRIASLLYDMTSLYINTGRIKEAEQSFKEALEMFKMTFLKNSTNLSEREKEKYWNTKSNWFERYLSFSVRRMKDNPDILNTAFDNLLFTKAILFNSTNKIKKRIMASNDSILVSKYKDFISKKEMLLKYFTMTKEQIDNQGVNIDSLERGANELEKEICLKSETYKQSYEKKKVSWRTIQSLLKPDEAAIEMARFRVNNRKEMSDSIYYGAFIITDQTTEHPDLVLIENGKELEDKYYSQYRNFVKNKMSDNESFNKFWLKIYERTKEFKKIYFSPDGIYNKLNLATLQLPNGKYLLDEQELQTVNSTQDLLLGYYSKQKETNIYNDAILIGNPDFSLSPDEVRSKERKIQNSKTDDERSTHPLIPSREGKNEIELNRLPGTEVEVNNVASYLRGKRWVVKTYLREEAVKGAIKSVNNPRVLHIATHGLFLSDIKPDDREILGISGERYMKNPLLRSGLFFAGFSNILSNEFNPSGNDNGFLTAYEAMNLDLDRTELVVLSACETGLGEIKNGEGVYSLQRAFQQAGAKTVLMSLWNVSDEATQELMTFFYQEWLSGRSKREAFNNAQMKIKEKYKYPYYWGAFVMVGE
jgi:CHAT domain-containing protein/Flp pilus assembly protein TadD